MTEAGPALTLSAAFLAGLAGSGHCFAMCGGFAAAIGMRAQAASGRALFSAAIYHAGRLSGYAVAGALAGLLGSTLQRLPLPGIAMALRVASGALLVLLGLRLLLAHNGLRWIEGLGARFWRLLQPLARFASTGNEKWRGALLGFLWGWLPCGLVYSTLLFAALNGRAAGGAGIMLAFGLGTLPSMLTSTLLASKVLHWSRQRGLRLAFGSLLIACGVALSVLALGPSPPAHHMH
ncbi:MAG TPA: sulfite exporter TauE/SafE family protein [Steroidobacteraceae bacterium]